MFKRLLSYFYPIKIHSQKSALSQSIEITWANGDLVMDSLNTNYSYGSLQRILKLGLKNIGFAKIKKMESVLILGVAGGSVIKTLVNDIHFTGKITGVEIDAEIIKIANQYFKLNKIPQLNIVIDDAFEFVLKTKEKYDLIIKIANQYFKLDKIPQLNIVIDDAFEFVLKTKDKYDLIIVDIFQDTKMPNFLFETFFIDRICFLLKNKGFILFNTMLLNKKENLRNYKLISEFKKENFTIKSIPRVEIHNELIVIEKLV